MHQGHTLLQIYFANEVCRKHSFPVSIGIQQQLAKESFVLAGLSYFMEL